MNGKLFSGRNFLVFLLVLVAVSLPVQARITIESTNYSPVPVSPGKSFQLWFHVKNNDAGESGNVIAKLDLSDPGKARPEFPFSLGEKEQAEKAIGSIKGFSSALVSYSVFVSKEALDEDYTVLVSAGEEGKPGYALPVTITVKAKKPQIELVESSVLETGPGQKIEAVLSLKNIGNSRAINIIAGLVEDRTVTSTGVVVSREISAVGVSTKYIQELSPGSTESVSLELAVDNDAKIKTYTVPITIKWADENRNEFSAVRYIGVRVQEEPKIDATIGGIEPKPYPGGESAFTIDLFNKGASTAKNTVVEVMALKGFEFSSAKFFIGSLDPDDFDSFTLNAKALPETKTGNYTLVVRILFKNPNFEDRVSEIEVPFKVVSSAEALKQGPLDAIGGLLGVIVIIAIAFFLYRRFRKKGLGHGA